MSERPDLIPVVNPQTGTTTHFVADDIRALVGYLLQLENEGVTFE